MDIVESKEVEVEDGAKVIELTWDEFIHFSTEISHLLETYRERVCQNPHQFSALKKVFESYTGVEYKEPIQKNLKNKQSYLKEQDGEKYLKDTKILIICDDLQAEEIELSPEERCCLNMEVTSLLIDSSCESDSSWRTAFEKVSEALSGQEYECFKADEQFCDSEEML